MFQSIETFHNGTLYRSRTEARYALMFESAGIEVQYEPDGYQFEEKGERYVPDFWIPAWDCFFEVKGDGFSLIPGEWPRERCVCEMINDNLHKDVLLAPGSPRLELWLFRFQPATFGFTSEPLANLVRAHAILTAKQHRFDWGKTQRDRPRRLFTGEKSIGDIASRLLTNLKPTR